MINVNYFFYGSFFCFGGSSILLNRRYIYIKPEGINLCGTNNL